VSSTENNRVFRLLGTRTTLDGMTPASVAQPQIPKITLRSPTDLIAATPYLLGFHPAESVVVVGFVGRQLAFAARSDLPGSGDPPARMVREILDVVVRQHADTVAIIGYGSAAAVDPLLGALRGACDRRGLPIKDVLRVDDGRWWSYLCDDPACCPPEGTQLDTSASETSALCTMEGLTAAPSRQDLERQVAPIGGLTRTSMIQATGRAKRRYARLLAADAAGTWADVVLAEGTAAVHAAISRYEEGGALDDDELAWLSLLLDAIAVRDVAWRTVSGEQHDLRLWTDVTQRADPALVAAPASLLAFAAWRTGDGVLAGLALERALRADPGYTMAHLLLRGLRQGLPPSALADWPAEAGTAGADGSAHYPGTGRAAGQRRRQAGRRRKHRRTARRRRRQR
jgi:hypothetical protein